MKLEIIATTLKEAKDIELAGADRIELVTGIKEGGLTPSIGLIKQVTETVKIPVVVMLRPHSKSFVYDSYDKKVILDDLEEIKKTKSYGIVFGCLTKDGNIDHDLLKEVIKNKGHLKITFHRAIDVAKDTIKAYSELRDYKIDTILTSGGFSNALEGRDIINQMVKLGYSNILAGSGLSPDNIEEFISNSLVSEVHMGSGVKFRKDNLAEIDLDLIKKVKDILNEKGNNI